MGRPALKDKITRIDITLFEHQKDWLDKNAYENNESRSSIIRKILEKEIKS